MNLQPREERLVVTRSLPLSLGRISIESCWGVKWMPLQLFAEHLLEFASLLLNLLFRRAQGHMSTAQKNKFLV